MAAHEDEDEDALRAGETNEDEGAPTVMEEVKARHRKETKALQAQIQALKKSAPKSDKKRTKVRLRTDPHSIQYQGTLVSNPDHDTPLTLPKPHWCPFP